MIATELRSMILGDRLPPGTLLPSEAELISQSGFSRASVREALRLLEAEGLITIRRGKIGGILVDRPDPTRVTRSLAVLLTLADAEIWQLTDFHKVVEPAVAACAARRATPEQRDALVEFAAVPQDPMASLEFHQMVAEATNHELYRVVLSALFDLTRWNLAAESVKARRVVDPLPAHRRIAAAIAKGDELKARDEMLRHLEEEEQAVASLGGLDRPIVARTLWTAKPS